MITHIIELSCDQPDCDAAYKPTAVELTSLQLTRTGSAIHGWTRHDGMDFCPDHRREDRDERAHAIRRLSGQRLNDTQIGQRLGLHRAVVQKIRADHGIPAGLGRTGRPSVGGAR